MKNVINIIKINRELYDNIVQFLYLIEEKLQKGDVYGANKILGMFNTAIDNFRNLEIDTNSEDNEESPRPTGEEEIEKILDEYARDYELFVHGSDLYHLTEDELNERRTMTIKKLEEQLSLKY